MRWATILFTSFVVGCIDLTGVGFRCKVDAGDCSGDMLCCSDGFCRSTCPDASVGGGHAGDGGKPDAGAGGGRAATGGGTAATGGGTAATGGGTAATGGGSSGGGNAGGGTATNHDAGCLTVTCNGVASACGNCIDDDGDGRIDWTDPECSGPCDNNEGDFDTGLIGTAQCKQLDCYYDTDFGQGDDGCKHDHRCDSLNPSAGQCLYDGGFVQGSSSCPAAQSNACLTACLPLVPAGCDCFGCCTVFLPDAGSRDIYLGSSQVTQSACTLATADNPSACRACTKVSSCENGSCGACQLCLGKTHLPDSCLSGPGSSTRCSNGSTPCGLSVDPPCPQGSYCLTGCCISSL